MPHSQGVGGVAFPRHQKVCTGSGVSICVTLAGRGRRGFSSTPERVRRGRSLYPCTLAGRGRRGVFPTPEGARRGRGLYLCHARRAWQAWRLYPCNACAACEAWHFLDKRRGAQGARPLVVPHTQGVAGALYPQHQRGCAGGGVSIRATLAGRGKRGFSSLWQAWHFLDTRRGAQGVRSLSLPRSHGAAGVAVPRHRGGAGGEIYPQHARRAWQA